MLGGETSHVPASSGVHSVSSSLWLRSSVVRAGSARMHVGILVNAFWDKCNVVRCTSWPKVDGSVESRFSRTSRRCSASKRAMRSSSAPRLFFVSTNARSGVRFDHAAVDDPSGDTRSCDHQAGMSSASRSNSSSGHAVSAGILALMFKWPDACAARSSSSTGFWTIRVSRPPSAWVA